MAAIWKRSLTATTHDYPEFVNHGWNHSGEIEWIKNDPFPTEIEDLLLGYDDSDEEIGSNRESDGKDHL